MSDPRRAGRRPVARAGMLWLIIGLCIGCASVPLKSATGNTPAAGEKAAKTALSMVGRPYKYKGDSPEGFDCSGLVRYSYLAAGVDLPHGTGALRPRTLPVDLRDLRKGDLLFFNEKGKKSSHVGIYLGNDLFVHAPSTGMFVRTESLLDPYWKSHFYDARRFN